MKALVLAGGVGSRLWPITHTSAKQLIPIANKPVLFYGLEAIAASGISDIGVVVGHTAPQIHEAIGTGERFGVDVTYIRQPEPLGLAHAVLVARDYLGDDDFLMYLGDNFIADGGIGPVLADFRQCHPAAQIMVARVADPHSFGVAQLDTVGQVTQLTEKPSEPETNLALVGVYVFGPEVHRAVNEIKPSTRGELEITDAIQWLIEAGYPVQASAITCYWSDTGSVPAMLEANQRVLANTKSRCAGEVGADCELRGPVVVEKQATVTRSRIVGPAIIGARSSVRDSRIGPFASINSDCEIVSSCVDNSIVLHGAYIRDIQHISSSIIGRHAEVTRTGTPAEGHWLIVGDHSKVRISS